MTIKIDCTLEDVKNSSRKNERPIWLLITTPKITVVDEPESKDDNFHIPYIFLQEDPEMIGEVVITGGLML